MGRKKRWRENVRLPLPEGTKARMDAALTEGEDRTDLMRSAIEAELCRRERSGNGGGNDASGPGTDVNLRNDITLTDGY